MGFLCVLGFKTGPRDPPSASGIINPAWRGSLRKRFKKSGNKKRKPKKNMVWSEEEATKYAEVLTDFDYKECLWLYQLENCALKKQANEELFGGIKHELEDALQEGDEEKFTVDRLRAKLKWFKKEWRRIDNKIKCGTGLGRDDTKEPKWFKILKLSPKFTFVVELTRLTVL